MGRDRRGRARRGARPARLPGADGHPQGARPASVARASARGVRRRVAARAPAHRARTSPTTWSWPRACRSRCSPCWRRSPPPNGRCSCSGRSSTPPYDEIAEAVGKSAAAVRQVAHRAREHVAARRPRMEVSRTEQQAVVERFVAAVTQGDLQGLLDVLAPDVVLVADGGGVVQAVVNPVIGAKKVANLLRPFNRLAPDAEILPVLLNGAPGLRIVGPSTAPTPRSASSSRTAGSPGSTRSAIRPSSVGSTMNRRSAASGISRECLSTIDMRQAAARSAEDDRPAVRRSPSWRGPAAFPSCRGCA